MPTILRTPDERFANLPDYPFEPNYVEVNGLRVHYVDEGEGEDVILCLHGEPTWSYLYRKMIPPLAQHARVIAPDFIGFGRSDKFAEMEAYTYHMHHDVLTGFIETLDLQHITLVCQDWGGVLGLPVATEMPERFDRLVIMNTFLPTGEIPAGEAFLRWRAFAEKLGTKLNVGQLINMTMLNGELPPEVIAAYDAPFPEDRYKAGAAIFPLLVPLTPEDPVAAEMKAAQERLRTWQKPALVLFAEADPILGRGGVYFRRLIPTAREQPKINIEGAGHFLQEEKGEEIAQYILDFLERTS